MASRIDNHVNGHNQSSREVHQEISRIRSDMDHTLEEIGGYLHPKHLLDYVVDSIRSGSPGSTKQSVREYAAQGMDVVKRHPGPALMAGGALLWYLIDQRSSAEDGQDYSSHSQRRRGTTRAATYGAWEEGYDWSNSQEDEQTWSEKAKQVLEQVRTVVADTTMAAKDKVKHVARHMVSASGKSREQLHAQWADLREHSGSYVDARTGEPYEDSYGDAAWSHAAACACLSDDDADDSSWSSKAQDVVNSMSESLRNSGSSVKHQFQSLGGHLSSLVSSGSSRMGDMMSSGRSGMSNLASSSREKIGQLASRSGSGVSRGWSSASSGLHSAAESAHYGASRVRDSVSSSVHQGSDQLRRAVHEQPLAVGAACLGLGLLAGLLAPSTRRENELMGDASDELKDQVKGQAREVGEQAMERGKEVAAAASAAVWKEADRQGLTPEKMAQSAKATGSASQGEARQTGASGSTQKTAEASQSPSHGLGTSATANPGSIVSHQRDQGHGK